MRSLAILALALLAVPAAANAGNSVQPVNEVRKAESRGGKTCVTARKGKVAARAECRLIRPVPPIVDPTPMFIL